MKQKLMNIVQNKEYRNLLLIAAYISLPIFKNSAAGVFVSQAG